MREQPPVKITVKAIKGFLWQVYPPRYIVPGQALELDAVTAREMVGAARAEYARAAKHTENRLDPKISEAQTTSMDVKELTNAELRTELSGSDDPDEMTVRELRDGLRARGETIPHNARKSQLIALYKGEDESC